MAGKIIVIGAGLGGLAAAVRLAAAGYCVSVYEKNPSPGGKLGEICTGAWRFDTGPSLLTMPAVLDQLFTDLGLNRQDYLDLIKLQVICRYFYPDGTVLDTSPVQRDMRAAIGEISPRDAERWPQYQEYCKNLYNRSAEIFLFNPIHEWRNLFFTKMIRKIPGIFRLDARHSMHERNARFFRDPRLIQLLDRYATYNGSDPFRAPATLNIISYVEYNPGAYYIRGGMYRLAKVLEELCRGFGVDIHYNQNVSSIDHRSGRVCGIRIGGRMLSADGVICNADVVHTFNHLIAGHAPFRRKLNRLEPSLSGMVFLWSVENTYKSLAHHNVFFSRDYRREFSQIFDNKMAPEEPTVYISITSKSDPGDAPAGCENWFVMVNMPYTTENQDWQKIRTETRRAILEILAHFGIEVEKHIRDEQVLTPVFFRDQLNSNRGSIYGISSNDRFTAFLRPANRNRQIRNLYFAGGSAHPGGGIPLVLLSGRICAELIRNKA